MLPWSCFQPPPHPLPLREESRRGSRCFRCSGRFHGRRRAACLPARRRIRHNSSKFRSCRFRRCTNSRGGRFSNFWRALDIRTRPMPRGAETNRRAYLRVGRRQGQTRAGVALSVGARRLGPRGDRHRLCAEKPDRKPAAPAGPASRRFCRVLPLCLPPRRSPERQRNSELDQLGDRSPNRSASLTAPAAASHKGHLRKGRLAQR